MDDFDRPIFLPDPVPVKILARMNISADSESSSVVQSMGSQISGDSASRRKDKESVALRKTGGSRDGRASGSLVRCGPHVRALVEVQCPHRGLNSPLEASSGEGLCLSDLRFIRSSGSQFSLALILRSYAFMTESPESSLTISTLRLDEATSQEISRTTRRPRPRFGPVAVCMA
ncbi:hypothetical protein AXG93_673s1030 [Marchantia polymorpha subsp. ruderalis]|uniref:Uncharacterized protein n=1 Tax=Marchantia polymorpha subsp. ruderalis TaxID=1480154 RepID=A0A176WL17_MARPO|nr:hypothetical protein AXG93_673s1030 [Marchantia polymorpha subsp. ruderalis]